MLLATYRRYKCKKLLHKLVVALNAIELSRQTDALHSAVLLLKSSRFLCELKRCGTINMGFSYRLDRAELPIPIDASYDQCSSSLDFSRFLGSPVENEIKVIQDSLINYSEKFINNQTNTIDSLAYIRKHHWHIRFVLCCTINLFYSYEWEPVK